MSRAVCLNCPDHYDVEVFLDGVRLDRCVWACEDVGAAVVEVERDGAWSREDVERLLCGVPKLQLLRGKVEIRRATP